MSTTTAARHRTGPSALAHFRTVWARAVVDRSTLIGVLAFYAVAFGAGVGALWIPLQDVFADIELPSAFDGLLGGLPLDTPAGWINAEMFSIVAPGFLIATALISASSAVAGEEQRRTLGLLLSTGLSRAAFLAAKAAAVLTHVLIVALGLLLGLIVGNVIGDLGLNLADLALATLWTVLISLVYGAIALTAGALTGDTKVTMALTAGIAAVSFVLSMFLPLRDSLTEWAKVNLWYPYSGNVALVDGFDWTLASVMLGITLVVTVIGFVGFHRRAQLRG